MVRNTAVQGSLSILYALLVIFILVACIMAIVKALRLQNEGKDVPSSEEPFTPSAYFAPSSLVTADVEKPIAEAWAERDAKELASSKAGK